MMVVLCARAVRGARRGGVLAAGAGVRAAPRAAGARARALARAAAEATRPGNRIRVCPRPTHKETLRTLRARFIICQKNSGNVDLSIDSWFSNAVSSSTIKW